jgi:dipeptidase
MGGNTQSTLNLRKPGTVEFRLTVSVAWCSYSFVAQLRDWLPDEVGGVCWMAVDNPGQSPRVPIFCGNSRLPQAYSLCGHKKYDDKAVLWQYRKANKLATVAWQRTKEIMTKEIIDQEQRVVGIVVAQLKATLQRLLTIDTAMDGVGRSTCVQ